jgi:hypothetical protein
MGNTISDALTSPIETVVTCGGAFDNTGDDLFSGVCEKIINSYY